MNFYDTNLYKLIQNLQGQQFSLLREESAEPSNELPEATILNMISNVTKTDIQISLMNHKMRYMTPLPQSSNPEKKRPRLHAQNCWTT